MEKQNKTLMETQYQTAINARDKLNDNYHKWMSYYYLANAGVIVAITSLYSKQGQENAGIFFLSFIGLFVCVLWHLSCKGYYYWSKSWIDIVIRLERKLIENTDFDGVYSVFSEEVTGEENFFKPNKSANISTPKLTLIFSFFSAIIWAIFSVYQFYTLKFFSSINCFLKLIIVISVVVVVVIFYYFFLPKIVESRNKNSHTLIKCRETS